MYQPPSDEKTPPPGFTAPTPYGGSPYGAPMTQAGPSSLAIAALVCGIVSWVGAGPVTAIPAIICGFIEVSNIDKGLSPPAGRAMANWGRWLGVANLVAVCLLIVGYFAFVAVIIGAIANSGGFNAPGNMPMPPNSPAGP
jgi:hypothetical protein